MKKMITETRNLNVRSTYFRRSLALMSGKSRVTRSYWDVVNSILLAIDFMIIGKKKTAKEVANVLVTYLWNDMAQN